MKKFLNFVLFMFVATLSVACGNNKTDSIVQEISGVWRANVDGSMLYLIYSENKLRVLIGDEQLQATLGEIDEENDTVNLKVTLKDGKPAVWTLRQIWDQQHKTFHLAFTGHDGTQDELSFVRKISTDDLNRLASLEAKNGASAVGDLVEPAPAVEPEPADAAAFEQVEESVVPTSAETSPQHFSPSFDCEKASNGAERLICSDSVLASLDVEMMMAFKRVLSVHPDKATLKAEQIGWMKNERNACSTSECMAGAYRERITALQDSAQYLSQEKPAEFR